MDVLEMAVAMLNAVIVVVTIWVSMANPEMGWFQRTIFSISMGLITACGLIFAIGASKNDTGAQNDAFSAGMVPLMIAAAINVFVALFVLVPGYKVVPGKHKLQKTNYWPDFKPSNGYYHFRNRVVLLRDRIVSFFTAT